MLIFAHILPKITRSSNLTVACDFIHQITPMTKISSYDWHYLGNKKFSVFQKCNFLVYFVDTWTQDFSRKIFFRRIRKENKFYHFKQIKQHIDGLYSVINRKTRFSIFFHFPMGEKKISDFCFFLLRIIQFAKKKHIYGPLTSCKNHEDILHPPPHTLKKPPPPLILGTHLNSIFLSTPTWT